MWRVLISMKIEKLRDLTAKAFESLRKGILLGLTGDPIFPDSLFKPKER